MLIGRQVFLRKLNQTDVDLVLAWENDPKNWEVSGTTQPYTKTEIAALVDENQSVEINKQVRFLICLKQSETPIGTIDLFEFDAIKKSVGVGVLIAANAHRQKGFASAALELIIAYCKKELKLKVLFCNIQQHNKVSVRLFEKCGFIFLQY